MDDFDAEAIVNAMRALSEVFENLVNALTTITENLQVISEAYFSQFENTEEDFEDEDSDIPELKPCPFCGKSVATLSNAKELEDCSLFEDDDRCPACMDWSGGCGYHTVVCGVPEGGCGAASGYYASKEEAVSAWNRRAKDAVPEPPNEEK